MVSYSLLAANQVMSMIFDGVFDRYPTLRIVFVEHAFSWILPLMWRMDAIYEARKSWLDIKRKPSPSTSRTTSSSPPSRWTIPRTRPNCCGPSNGWNARRSCSSPPTTRTGPIDDPRWLVKHLPEHAREAVMFRNGIETYKLPETVPALEGQTRVF